MADEVRTPIDVVLDGLDWRPIPGVVAGADCEPVATHSGVLMIGDAKLRVYQLSDGRRVIDAADLGEFFGEAGGG